jgi:hypothetical protein
VLREAEKQAKAARQETNGIKARRPGWPAREKIQERLAELRHDQATTDFGIAAKVAIETTIRELEQVLRWMDEDLRELQAAYVRW